MVGQSASMQEVRRLVRRFAGLAQPVLVHGETGVGKELVALALHRLSGRTGPFVAINCGAIPDSLAESTLFGHVRGAFTGALRDTPGAFARAAGGTLFLDEIGELPRRLQAMLLRALESRTMTPIGAARELSIEARVVTATHRDLESMAQAGDFREDLLHRLRIFEVRVPALRERPSDIAELLRHFCEQASAEHHRPIHVTSAALLAATDLPWPGNVRALRNAVIRAAALSDSGQLSAADLLADRRPPRAWRLAETRSHVQDQLLADAVRLHGSIRKAATALGIPRSTLGARLQRAALSSATVPLPEGAGVPRFEDSSATE